MTSRSIKGIIFDCDGTLIDSEPAHFLSWQEALELRGHSLTKESYTHQFAGKSEFTILHNLGLHHTDTLLDDKHAAFAQKQSSGLPPIAATVDFARQLFECKQLYRLKLGVASGAQKIEILHHLKSLQIEHYFDIILSGRDDLAEYQDPEGTNKPKPYVYLKAAKLLGCKPEECIAIEDSNAGVSAAVTAGCFTIAIPNAYTKGHDFSHAHAQLESLAGMTVDAFFELVR
jgi:beta-phosphoglucomutase-like phosphatase (HAD superfamily)